MGFNIPQKYGHVIIKLHLVPACWGRLGKPQSSGWLESGRSFQCRTKTVTLPVKSSFMFDAVDDRVTSRGQYAHQFNLKLISAMADRCQDFILNLSFAKLEYTNNLIWTSVLVVALYRTWLEHWKNKNCTWTQKFTKKIHKKRITWESVNDKHLLSSFSFALRCYIKEASLNKNNQIYAREVY